MAREQEKDLLPPNRPQVTQLTVYPEPLFSLLGSRAILNVTSDRQANNLKLSLNLKERHIIVANGSTADRKG